MTKRQLKRWLENKREYTLAESRELYRTTAQQLIDETFADLGLREVAEQIQPLLEQAVKLWDDWKNQQLENSDLDFYSNYCGLGYALSDYAGDADSLYQRITHDIRLQSVAAKNLKKESHEREQNISKSYCNLLSVVESMSTAKEAEAYLTSLGFDLAEQYESSETSSALVKNIDVSYLFVQKAA